ncbi:MAG: PEP-CTERM system histidine kinase PrsK, partial [Methylomonas sp.]|nr:PEP-CTERM system histidine kinase PrsK [Methylomonas sp.]
MHSSLDPDVFLADTLLFETLRNIAWLSLLTILLSRQSAGGRIQFFIQTPLTIPLVFLILFTLSIEAFPDFLEFILSWSHQDPRFFSHVLFAIVGLILIEQLYRNTPLSQRWNIKFICLGLGALFIVDFLGYSKSLLYKHIDIALWQSRGIINALITPMLAVAHYRLTLAEPGIEQTAPRTTVFYTSILFGCGIYLILMSAAGYYVKQTNAEWGDLLQTVFIFLALLLLAISFTSGKIRALAKVYFSKHFFHYNYDYREEWLKISKALAQLESLEDLKRFIIDTLMNLVESSGGGLWLKNEQGQFILAAEHNLHLSPQELNHLKNGHDLPHYLASKQWVIDFFE